MFTLKRSRILIWWVISLYSAIFNVTGDGIESSKGRHHDCPRLGKGRITAAMIASTEIGTPDELRVRNYVDNFTASVFEGVNLGYEINFKYWPPIFSQDCNQEEPGWDKGRGSNLAHKETWDHFVRYSTNCEDVLVVFEYDAFIGRESAGKLAIDFIENRNASTDILYLGYCYHHHEDHPQISHKAPFCLHAYALTVHGAKRLLKYVDACGAFADAAVAGLINEKKIVAEYMSVRWDPAYLTQRFNEEGIHWSGFFEYDGSIAQVKWDSFPPPPKEGDIVSLSGSKTMYYFTQNSWRVIPNKDVLVALSTEGRHHTELNTWQMNFNRYRKGSEIIASDILELKDRLKNAKSDS